MYFHLAMNIRPSLVISSALFAASLPAQTSYAPICAKWYYKQAHWGGPDTNLMVIEATGDTLIEGRTCRTLHINQGWYLGCHQLAMFLSESQDSLFYFASATGQHHLVFRWDAGIGDSWTTPVIQFGQEDTLVWTVLDTSMVMVDGFLLRSLEVDVGSRQWSSFGFGGIITERLGNAVAPFAWLYGVCDGEIFAGLRCYEDADIAWQSPQVAQCALGVGFDEHAGPQMEIRPTVVRAGEPITITATVGSVAVLDATGRQLSMHSINGDRTISLDRPGIYSLRLSTILGAVIMGRVLVH